MWSVDNRTDFFNHGIGELRLMGVSFTVISLQWGALPSGSALVECRRPDEECRLVQTIRRGQLAEPRYEIKTIVNTNIIKASTNRDLSSPTTESTTRRRGSFFFPDEERTTASRPERVTTTTSRPTRVTTQRSSKGVCVAVGQFRRRRGMDQWCMMNCHATPVNCPPTVCGCSPTKPR